MKILYVDISLQGHRKKYLEALATASESILLLPQELNTVTNTQYIMGSNYDKKRSLFTYYKWIKEIRELVRKEQIDIVHFLCGDALYRYFGLLLPTIPCKVFITYHHMLFSTIRKLSLRNLFSHSVGIVHTDALLDGLTKIGINNVKKIEYPVFMEEVSISNYDAKRKLGLQLDRPCITVLGGTQRYKGLDILLSALNNVNAPFQLYITGLERAFSKDYIIEHSKKYQKNVKLHLSRLTEEEYRDAVAATDLIVLPYRYEFDGASGPMIEGVWNRKYIVGASHGSMGRIIQEHNLGTTFKTEDPSDLARVLNIILQNIPRWSQEAESYRKELTVEKFIERYLSLYNAY